MVESLSRIWLKRASAISSPTGEQRFGAEREAPKRSASGAPILGRPVATSQGVPVLELVDGSSMRCYAPSTSEAGYFMDCPKPVDCENREERRLLLRVRLTTVSRIFPSRM